jgi:hypothetical protein
MSVIAEKLYIHESNANIICDRFVCSPFIAKDHPQAVEYIRASLAMRWVPISEADLQDGDVVGAICKGSNKPTCGIISGFQCGEPKLLMPSGSISIKYVEQIVHIKPTNPGGA